MHKASHWQGCVVSSGPHLAMTSALQCGPHSVLPMSRLQGTIPSSLFAQPSIRVLDLGGNRFSGTLPNLLVKMTSLSYLELGANRLSGRPALLLQPAALAPAA